MQLRPHVPTRAVSFMVLGLLFYGLLSAFLNPLILRDFFNALALGMAVTIVLTWGRSAINAMRRGVDESEWMLIVGIFLFWLIFMFWRIYAIVFNAMGRPDWLSESFLTGFWPYSYTLAGALFLIAPGVAVEPPSRGYLWHILFAVGLGCLVSGILIGYSVSSDMITGVAAVSRALGG